MLSRIVTVLAIAALGVPMWAQSADTTQSQQTADTAQEQQSTSVQPMDHTPVFRVNVVSRTTQAINYRARKGTSTVGLRGTDLMQSAKGKAKVESKSGRLGIEASLEGMRPASKFGPEYLTYVLWAITPQGRASNLGEIILDDDGNAHTTVSTDLQAFGLIVTAEPYFAVTQPSNLVVVENVIGKDTVGWAQPINAKFEALQRGDYTVDIPATQLPSITANPKTPLELLEAENAVAIAKATGAEKYAPETLQKAEEFLAKGKDYLNRKQSLQAIGTVARGATQQAEDARLLTIRRKEEERLAAERAAQQQRTEEARARAEAATQQAAQESARAEQAQQERLAAEQARAQAEQAQQQAQAEAQRAQQERQQAEAARQAALQQQQQLAAEAQRAQMTAQQAQQARLQTEQQAQQQRERLLNQLNSVLQTKETARGLIVNMSDVLFDLNKATLKPGAKIRLAKVAGILMAYPDLHLQIEGFTDNTGTAAYNQQLSQRRAAAVRDYLISEGVPVSSIVAQGYGEADPVASNSTPEGRQLNRRVDMVVSGQAIGVNQTAGPGNSGAVQAGGSATSGGVSGSAVTGATNESGAGVSAGTTGAGTSVGAGASANTPVGSGSVSGNTGAPVSTQPATPPAPPQK